MNSVRIRRPSLILLIATFALFSFSCSTASRTPDVRYQPTTDDVVTAMLELAEVGKSDVVYDLGSGDGRIVIAAAHQFGARGVGIDVDPQLIRESRENAVAAKVSDRVVFRQEDLFTANFREATVVTLFLWPDLNLKLRPRLLAELAPGTRVVSNRHPMGDWIPTRTIYLGERPLHLWRIPPR
jgi:SAM-dependent methyltransferase